jgi:hypothetical protein
MQKKTLNKNNCVVGKIITRGKILLDRNQQLTITTAVLAGCLKILPKQTVFTA